jgi:uncharacterized membrane protein YkoI
MKTSTKLIAVCVLAGLGGTIRLVHAAQSQSQAPIAILPEHRNGHPMAQVGNGDRETKDDTKGQASDRDKETNDDAQEKAADRKESAKLQPLAKITAQQAQQAAESWQGGQSAKDVKLENEDGSLIYSVEIGNQEVTVDAGNGKILSTETANQKNKADQESYPRSSIQVTEAPGGDGDGETNDDG